MHGSTFLFKSWHLGDTYKVPSIFKRAFVTPGLQQQEEEKEEEEEEVVEFCRDPDLI